MLTRTVFAFALSATISVSFAQSPDYWVLVHTGDQTAKTQILAEKDYAKAREIAAKLGYEAVVERRVAYFFPVPSWSGARGAAIQKLLSEAINEGFDRELDVGKMPAYQREHLKRFLSGVEVGGDLGARIKQTDLSRVTLRRTVDLQFEVDGHRVVVPFAEKHVLDWYYAPRRDLATDAPAPTDFPERKELFGLGTQDFAVSVSKPTTSDAFEGLVNRAQILLSERRAALLQEVEGLVDSAFEQVFASESAKKLMNGEKTKFGSLPEGLQVSLKQHMKENPGIYGFDTSQLTSGDFATAEISIPDGGLRLFMSFMLDGSVPASDGSPVRYAVSWEVTEILSQGG
ncbi:MAG: hypothetical protein WD716_10820 [Fimbriimonadaceae bacterium]